MIARGGSNLKMLKLESEASINGEGIYSLNFPNPVLKELSILFESLNPKNIAVVVYNIRGQEVFKSSINGKVGVNKFTWDTRSTNGELVSSGIYLMNINDGKINKEKIYYPETIFYWHLSIFNFLIPSSKA